MDMPAAGQLSGVQTTPGECPFGSRHTRLVRPAIPLSERISAHQRPSSPLKARLLAATYKLLNE